MNQDSNIGRVAPEPLTSVVPESNDNNRFFGEESPVPAENVINPEVPAAAEDQVAIPVVEAQNPVLEPVTTVPASPAEAVSSETANKNIPDQAAICTDKERLEEAFKLYNTEQVGLGEFYEASRKLYQQKE